jgi:hypothetical protein
VVKLINYATISVPLEVKKRLQQLKGEKEWGEFLVETCTATQQLRSKKALNELRKLLTKQDLEALRQSSKEFRENFKFR